jgi:hypothetical protein
VLLRPRHRGGHLSRPTGLVFAVHIIGKIKGAYGFHKQPGLSLSWRIVADPESWAVMDGKPEGRTQVDVAYTVCVTLDLATQ